MSLPSELGTNLVYHEAFEDGDGPMDKATLALLRERFNIFDNLNTGWIDSKDVRSAAYV